MQNILVKVPIILGVDRAWYVKFNSISKSYLFASLLRLWNICGTCKSRVWCTPPHHMLAERVASWTVNQSSVVGTIWPSTRRFAVDFTRCFKFWTNYSHLICRNFICQPSAVTETRIKQRAFALNSCWFVRHPAGISRLLCIDHRYFSAVNASQTEHLICFTSLTSFVHKRMLTNRPCHRGRERA